MALETPNLLIIGTNNTHLAEYDKFIPSPETQEETHEKSARSDTDISEPPTLPPNPVKFDQKKSENTANTSSALNTQTIREL
jgi:hypothetical protein